MSINTNVRKQASLGGLQFSANKVYAVDEHRARQISVAAAKTGALTTRTDDDTGTLTMDPGHGITTGAIIDIYWTEGGVDGQRRSVTVGTVAGDSVPFGAGGGEGSGDVLPTNGTPVTVKVVQVEEFIFEGDDTNVIAFYNAGDERAQIRFHDAGGEELNVTLEPREVYLWDENSGVTNPIAGDSIIAIHLSHADSAAAAVVRAGVALTN